MKHPQIETQLRNRLMGLACGFLLFANARIHAAELPLVTNVDWQPFTAQIKRVIEATDSLGSPFTSTEKDEISRLMASADSKTAELKLQNLLDAHSLFGVNINPEMRVKVSQGPAKPELDEQGWCVFLVKIQNESGTTADLRAVSPNALSVFEGGATSTPSDKALQKSSAPKPELNDRWLDLQLFNQQPLPSRLSGLALDYRIVQLYSRDAGKREARISFNVGQGTQDLGFRNDVDILFTALPAEPVTLRVLDEHGEPTIASFEVRDAQQRVYPAISKRLAPDFAFHPQVYRADGDVLKLPRGEYTVLFLRGPESIPQQSKLAVSDGPQTNTFKVIRWIDPSTFGWWSGDHHIHAAGCAHYVKPTEGVRAEDMIRHCMGEDLKIGANLTWGPCFDYQKQFFCGTIDKVSQYPYLLRYDIEVSGFGSHQSGHLCLLRLKEEIYPGGDSKDHWPTLCLNTLRWAKKQGSVCGPAHSGWGLQVKSAELPNYEVPPFDGIGANEYIVDVTHELPGPDGKPMPAVDFLSMGDTPSVWELNMWYHTLNVGYRTRISGETDFPCIYGEKVGLGRSYVKLDGRLDYDQWCEGIRRGRNYVGDGKSHLMEFTLNATRMGENGSELKLAGAGTVHATARVAAYLPENANEQIRNRKYDQQPYWDIERARIEGTRKVNVEAIVNGKSVARKELAADGTIRDIAFDLPIAQSSWVALRILPSSHTNPIFVLVGDKPIRASRRSAQWCLDGVEKCQSQKKRFIKAGELKDFETAYAHAHVAYQKLLAECESE
jgi:hypothetical protein